MEVDAGERRSLVNLVAEVFKGAAGTSNHDFQVRFATSVDNYKLRLGELNKAIGGASGTGGTLHQTDQQAASYFPV
ncbi:hypothetical protein [Nocardia iowensis]|uniref:WXG100 family type VII secretion target n=1 Tax=Nocardia iowensis TaxID=204891 RepID=A0ABX8RZJ0_NOCIO|nr:hypothetical protein [Nocardia iowensis]QXN94676.1 hypothetical protein KV110_17440 [Nocardia iowensis]